MRPEGPMQSAESPLLRTEGLRSFGAKKTRLRMTHEHYFADSISVRVSVNDSAAVGTEIHASVDSRITRDGLVGQCVLVASVINSRPAKSGIVGAINAPHASHFGAAV